MANKAISELPQAQNVNNQDLFVLEQSGIAKKLPAETFITEQGIINALAEALDGHGGISSVTLSSVSGRIRTYLITFTDETTTTFQVLDGTSIDRIEKTSTAGLVDTYTIFMSDGTTSFFQVTNGNYGLDRTLTMSNAAAPADLVGDLKNTFNGKYSVSPTWELGNIDNTGHEVTATNRARMTTGVKTIPTTVLKITNNLTASLGVAINYYDINGVFLSQDASHWSGASNQIGIGSTLSVPINVYGYVRCSVNIAGVITITDAHLEALEGCFDVFTNEETFDHEKDIIALQNNDILISADINRKAGMLPISPTWEQGNISGTGSEVTSTTRARMTVGVKTVPNSILRIVNKFNNRFIGVAINYYDINNVWQSQDASHWTGNDNVIHVGDSLEVSIISYGYVRCSINLQSSPTITDEMLATLHECFEVYTNENIFELYATVEDDTVEYAPSVDEIKTVRNLQTDGSICFTWMSDSHYQVNKGTIYGTPITLFKESGVVADYVKSDFFIHTGDIVNGNSDIAYQEDDLVDVVNAYANCKIPVWMVEGNHDDNSWYMKNNGDSTGTYQGMAQVLTNEKLTSYIMNNQLNHVEVDSKNPTGGYFYKDFKKAKIRVICLNTTDIPYIENADGTLKYYGQWTMGFQADQMNWLANTALKFTEAGWGVVFFMHYDGQLDDALDNVIVDPKCWYYVKQIISAYRSKTSGTIASDVTDFPANFNYDFTQNASNTVVAYFSGHVHKDQYAVIDGVPHVSIVCSFNDGQTGGYGFDVVTLDRTNKVINTIRYNGGEMSAYNRHISWS